MGIPFSCPFAQCNDVENDLDSIMVKSINFGDEIKTPVRSISFNSGDSEPKIFKSMGSGKMTLEISVSFKESQFEKMISMSSIKSSSFEKDDEKAAIVAISPKSKEMMNHETSIPDGNVGMIKKNPVLDSNNPEHVAALKLQKVYKSFRTRRKLADCAVLVEQSWWKLLDFAELKRSSISFFDVEKHETAISRWSRAITRAAKVGKGLSKNDKAQKLSLQHWLEAIDPRHRYGHNLHFYYVKWLECQSREPFFYWLDIGEGREVNLVEKCPRSKLQQQCIKYLGPMERLSYEVVPEDGKFWYKQSGDLLHTSGEPKAKWIFVLSTTKNLYVGKKKKGAFQHSSFLAGGATLAAGRLVIENGILKAVWPHSGHYRPTKDNFKDFILFLRENDVDLTDVKSSSVDEEDGLLNKKKSSLHHRTNSSDEDFIEKSWLEGEGTKTEECIGEKSDSSEQETSIQSKRLHSFSKSLTDLEIPSKTELTDILERENQDVAESPAGGYETAEDPFTSEHDQLVPVRNLFDQVHEENEEVESIAEESILERISSHKGMKSYQLGKQLSCKWTTGAGPRIGCVRDYPSELQVRALEHVSLSPRSAAARSRSLLSSCGLERVNLSPGRSVHNPRRTYC